MPSNDNARAPRRKRERTGWTRKGTDQSLRGLEEQAKRNGRTKKQQWEEWRQPEGKSGEKDGKRDGGGGEVLRSCRMGEKKTIFGKKTKTPSWPVGKLRVMSDLQDCLKVSFKERQRPKKSRGDRYVPLVAVDSGHTP